MADDEIDIRGILGLLHRQIHLILGTVIVALGVAVICLFALDPIYTAKALVLVDPSQKNLLETRNVDSSGVVASARVESEVEILKSSAALLSVIKNADLISDVEFGVRAGWSDKLASLWQAKAEAPANDQSIGNRAVRDILARVEHALKVRRDGITYLISVSFSASSPERAADLANAVTDAYIANQLAAKVRNTLAVRDILKARIAEASGAIAASEVALGDYVFANLERISRQTGNSELSQLRSQLTGVENRQQEIEQLSAMLDVGRGVQDWSLLAQQLGLEAVAELDRQRQKIVEDIAQADAADRIDLAAELKAIEKQMSERAAQEFSQLAQSGLTLRAQSNDLRRQIRVSAISSDLPADMVTEIFELQQNANEARHQYQTLLSRLREVETQVDLQIADSRVVSRALPPNAPSFPNKIFLLSFALVAGLGAGTGLGYLNEHYIGGFTSFAQVEAVLKLPVLAGLPKLKISDMSDGLHPATSVLQKPLSRFSESIRRVRANIDQAIRQGVGLRSGVPSGLPGSIIMVCSAVPGEGKTTVALSLARAYALSGQSTLLIDADMRHPAIQGELGLTDSKIGLFEFLSSTAGDIPLSSAVSNDRESDLQVLVGARASHVPTDQLFASKRFASLLEGAADHFDIVILDTPPAGPVVDALYLAQYVDFLVFVVRWVSTSQREVRSALSRLQDVLPDHAKTGIVLNQQDNGMLGEFANYEGYYNET